MSYDRNLLTGLTTLHALNGAELRAFLEVCTPARVPADTLLIEQEDVDRSMVFVREGELEVFIGAGDRRIVVREVGHGGHVGAASVLGLSERRVASVRTLTPATLLVVERADVEALDRQGNRFVKNLESEVLHELVEGEAEIVEVLRRTTVGRVLPDRSHAPPTPGLFRRLASSLFGASEVPRSEEGEEEAPEAPADARGLALPPSWLPAPHTGLRVRRGEVLIGSPEGMQDAFYVVDGQVGRYAPSTVDGHVLLGLVRPGQIGGFEPALGLAQHPFVYVAERDSRVLLVPVDLCADAVILVGEERRALRRRMLETAAARYDSASRMLFRAVARSVAGQATRPLDEHPDYRRACALSARWA